MSLQYQDFLLEEFKARRSRNPSYSLRAYARDIGMPASKLSQNLRGLCGISVAKAEKIADKLQMAGEERALFLALVEAQHARSRVARDQAKLALSKLRDESLDKFSLEKFAVVRDWYHIAILEMARLPHFNPDPQWIAGKLGVEVDTIRAAIERLKQIDLLMERDGKLSPTERDLELTLELPSRTIREHHKQILTKAIDVMDTSPVERREYSSQMFTIDQKHVPEIKELIRGFQRKLAKLSHDGQPNALYSIAIQFFPLAEIEK